MTRFAASTSAKSAELRKFGFWVTILSCLITPLIAMAATLVAQFLISIWWRVLWAISFARIPDPSNIELWPGWLDSLNRTHIFFVQLITENFISFMNDSISWSLGLLVAFWCNLELRRRFGVRISVSSAVITTCIFAFCVSIVKTGANILYSWSAYKLASVGCDSGLIESCACNFVLLDVGRILSGVANFLAVAFAGKVYSQRLDDTEAWRQDLERRMDEKMAWYAE